MVRCVCALLACIIVASSLAAQTPRRPPAADPDRRNQVIERWLKEGSDVLSAGAYDAARERFGDVIDLDPRNAQAHHGAALAYVGLGDLKRAAGAMEAAMDAEIRGGGIGKVPRPLLLNYAMVMIAAGNPMRGAKFLIDHQRILGKPDEPVLNALAVALNTADPPARKTTQYTQAARFYEDFNAKLEAARPGQKRWGVAWKTPADHEQLVAMWRQDLAGLEALYPQVEAKAQELAAIQDRHDKAQALIDQTGITPRTMPYIRSTLASTRREFEQLVKTYETRAANIRKPTLPATLSAVPMNGPVETAVAVLSGSQAVPEQVPSRRAPRRPAANVPETPAPLQPPVERPVIAAPSQAATPELVLPRQQGKRTVIRAAAAFAIAPDLLLTSALAVADAKEIQVTDLNGEARKGRIVRTDDSAGLALIRVEGGRMLYAQLADSFKGGAVQCVSLAPGIFQPTTEAIPGSIKITGDQWTLSLQRAPRRIGAPVVAMNKVVGVEPGDRGGESSQLPVVSLERIRGFCADELSAVKGPYAGPAEVLAELLITSEVQQ